MSRLGNSAFTLSPGESEQISLVGKRHARRRCQSGHKISDRMSIEAQLAMQMAMDDMHAKPCDVSQQTSSVLLPTADDDVVDDNDLESGVDYSSSESSIQSNMVLESGYGSQRALAERNHFTSLYGNLARARMPRDITDSAYLPDREPRRPLDRTLKLENTLDIIETVKCDETNATSRIDDIAIEELAKINSVDKCRIWMEATKDVQRLSDIR
ncbi:hypothetical protein NP493_1029g01024 [Ridgeia piscesae]|uniref:Uncharacterized protein n=1 Tax=Ridgeia piscesae TaxID=27915 RepID=A0AAD9NIX9_RIDPI|nr:hypothetical protein NP493_1029g01024 [Ridgeia piscesae]